MCLFSGLGALGLVGPDEPRYAAIARAMAETQIGSRPGCGARHGLKSLFSTTGLPESPCAFLASSEFAARLPSALAALLAVVAVAWTALRSYGVGAAWYSLLILPTSRRDDRLLSRR